MSGGLLTAIIGLALLDSLNPSLFITQFYLLTTPRPAARMASYIAGVLAVNLAAGLLLLAGFQAIFDDLIAAASPALWRWLELAAGGALIGAALWLRGRALDRPAARRPRSLHPFHTFLLGAFITLQEVSTAMPYLVAIERVSQAKLGLAGNLLALGAYNALYVAPLVLIVSLFLARGASLAGRLERINQTISRWLPRVIAGACLAGGGLLLTDALLFFALGRAPL